MQRVSRFGGRTATCDPHALGGAQRGELRGLDLKRSTTALCNLVVLERKVQLTPCDQGSDARTKSGATQGLSGLTPISRQAGVTTRRDTDNLECRKKPSVVKRATQDGGLWQCPHFPEGACWPPFQRATCM